MPQVYDMTKQKWGKLTAIKPAGQDSKRNVLWLCKCDCGKELVIPGYGIRRGDSRSCGCGVGSLPKHGRHGTPEHKAWCAMIGRCENQNDKDYKNYGNRGIKVCSRWRNSFASFLNDMGERPDAGYSIDRIDVNGNYEPSNCKWSTKSEQNSNQRRSLKNRK